MALSTAATPLEPKKARNEGSKAYVTTGTFQRYSAPRFIGPPMSPSSRKPFVWVIQDSYGPSSEKARALNALTLMAKSANKKQNLIFDCIFIIRFENSKCSQLISQTFN